MSTRVRVKICGIRTAEDLAAAIDAGTDAVGFNFYPNSPRYVEPALARVLIRAVPPFVEAFGVFAHHPVQSAHEVAASVGHIHTLQFHNNEHKPIQSDKRIIPAFAVRDVSDMERIDAYLQRCLEKDALPAAVLVDGFAPGLAGGTGRTAPWELLAHWNHPVPLILAGGLTPENVAEAVRQVRPYAVDVAGGVESAPGRKDADKMRRFVEQVRNV